MEITLTGKPLWTDMHMPIIGGFNAVAPPIATDGSNFATNNFMAPLLRWKCTNQAPGLGGWKRDTRLLHCCHCRTVPHCVEDNDIQYLPHLKRKHKVQLFSQQQQWSWAKATCAEEPVAAEIVCRNNVT